MELGSLGPPTLEPLRASVASLLSETRKYSSRFFRIVCTYQCARASDLSMQPGSGYAPVTLHSPRSNLQHFRRFLDSQASKETHFDDLALPGRHLGKAIQRLIQCNDFARLLWRPREEVFVQSTLSA